MNNSLTLLSLSLALVLSANAAWGETRIERDNRTNSTKTAQQSRPGAPQTNSQRTTVTGDGNSNTRTQTNTQSGGSSTNTQTNGQTTGQTTVVTSGSARFACENVNGQLTVIYRPQSRQNEAYPWAVPADMGSAWNAQRRCGEIARRLEFYRPDGLQELRTGIQNQHNVVCVTTEKDQSCRIVFTVPTKQDPIITRDQVFRNLTLADSGQQTAGVNTFAGTNSNNSGGDFLGGLFGSGGNSNTKPRSSSSGLDLRPFLSVQDGGTGNQIGNPVPVPAQYRLNPDNFR